MDVKYIGYAYQIAISDLQYTICCDSVVECKQRFLDIVSKEFDETMNGKLGDYGFGKENEQMSCKYPKENRMHYACLLCDEKNVCKDTITSSPSQKNVIPSASEANRMTNNVINSCVTQQLTELSTLIRDAIADGKFSIYEDGCLESETRKKLEEIGYKVDTGTQYNESYYSISWKENK